MQLSIQWMEKMLKKSEIKRRVSKKIFVGSVSVGGDSPISVQSMTNTDTEKCQSYY